MPLHLNPPTLPKPPGYTQMVETTGGRTLYISGQIALDAQGQFLGMMEMGSPVLASVEASAPPVRPKPLNSIGGL